MCGNLVLQILLSTLQITADLFVFFGVYVNKNEMQIQWYHPKLFRDQFFFQENIWYSFQSNHSWVYSRAYTHTAGGFETPCLS